MTLRRRKAILHIGTEKTGSTTLQDVMAANRQALVPLGFAYPESPGEKNHGRLALYAGDARYTKGLARREVRASGAPDIAEWFPEELERELAALPDGVHTVVFSNEHCHSRLVTDESVGRLKELLDRFFEGYRILVYLRRQDDVAVSRHSTALRTGSVSTAILPDRPDGKARLYFDYAALLDRWGAVFGRAALAPRRFDRDAFVDGDLVADFLAGCGVTGLHPARAEAARNPSLVPAAQEFLLRFNRVYERDPNRRRPNWIADFLGAEYRGAGRLPSRAEAEAFVGAFAEGNERIRAEFFPDRPSLFSTDWSRYPEGAPPPVPDADVLDVAMAVVAHLSEQPEPKAARAARKAAEAPEGAAPAAEAPASPEGHDEVPAGSGVAPMRAEDERAELRRALDAEPTNVKALRRLARLAHSPAQQEEARTYVERASAATPGRKGLLVLGDRIGRGKRVPPPPGDDAPGAG